jgi:hypothetical protein
MKSVSQPYIDAVFANKDGVCTDLFEDLGVNNLKGDLSNATIFNPPLFSLVIK